MSEVVCTWPRCPRPVARVLMLEGVLSGNRRKWFACAHHRQAILTVIGDLVRRHDPDGLMAVYENTYREPESLPPMPGVCP